MDQGSPRLVDDCSQARGRSSLDHRARQRVSSRSRATELFDVSAYNTTRLYTSLLSLPLDIPSPRLPRFILGNGVISDFVIYRFVSPTFLEYL